MPLGAFQKIYGARQSLQLVVKPRVGRRAPGGDGRRHGGAARARGGSSRPSATTSASSPPTPSSNLYKQATSGIFAVLVGVVALSLVVGGIVIMNIMLMVVSERTREIGLRKALGARRADIMSQVLTESVTLSIFGGIVGIALGFLAAHDHRRGHAAAGAARAVVGRARHRHHRRRRAVLRRVSRVARRARSTRSRRCAVNRSLAGEVVRMALDTLRSNKLRSALTILGVVIGITAIVGMTSLIRGFDQSLRDSMQGARAEHDLPHQVQHRQHRRRRRVLGPAAAAEPHGGRRQGDREAGAVDRRSSTSGSAPACRRPPSAMYYRGDRTKQLAIVGATEQFAEAQLRQGGARPLLHRSPRCSHRRRVVGARRHRLPGAVRQAGLDPIGKKVRIGAIEYTVIGVLEQAAVGRRLRQRSGRLRGHPADHAPGRVQHQRHAARGCRGQNSATIMVVPLRTGAARGRRWPRSRRSCASGTA